MNEPTRKTVRLLFPIVKTIERLQLRVRWWHRGAEMSFVAVLIAAFLFGAWLGLGASIPEVENLPRVNCLPEGGGYRIEQDCATVSENTNDYATPLPAGATPDGTPGPWTTVDAPPAKPIKIERKSIEMPNGRYATYTPQTPDETIKNDWK